MTQSNFILSDLLFPATRVKINEIFEAGVTNSAGGNLPSVTFPCQWAAQTANKKLYMRNSANTSWIEIGDLEQPYLGLTATKLGGLVANNNLNDLPDKAAARANLGISNANVKNLISNGNFIISQKFASSHPRVADNITKKIWIVDRWAFYSNADGNTNNSAQINFSPFFEPTLKKHVLNVNFTNAIAQSANNFHILGQKIEASAFYDLDSSLYYSFLAKTSTGTRKIGVEAFILDGTTVINLHSATYTLTTANQVFGNNFTINSDFVQYLKQQQSSSVCVGFYIWFQAGSNTRFAQKADIATVGANTITIQDVSLTTQNLAAQKKTYEEELESCQKYFQKSYLTLTSPGITLSFSSPGVVKSASNTGMQLFYSPMKFAPTLTTYDLQGNANKISKITDISTGAATHNLTPVINSVGTNSAFVQETATSGLQLAFAWTADTENSASENFLAS